MPLSGFMLVSGESSHRMLPLGERACFFGPFIVPNEYLQEQQRSGRYKLPCAGFKG